MSKDKQIQKAPNYSIDNLKSGSGLAARGLKEAEQIGDKNRFTTSYKGDLRKNGEGIYRENNGELIFGKSLFIYIHNLNYYLTELRIYADGKIDCWELVNYEEFVEKVINGWVVTELPKNTEVSVFQLGCFTATAVRNWVKPEELVKEVADIIKELNGIPDTSKICQLAFEEYQKNPIEDNKERLRTAYESIPEHNRRYVLGDMDRKDGPIRSILYGEETETL